MKCALGWLALVIGAGAPLEAAPFDVRTFGATGDGRTLDTDAINMAIVTAHRAGGGTVVFPAGDYLSFSIQMRSRVTMHLEAGATLIAAEPTPDLRCGYDAPEPNQAADYYQDFGHSHWHNSLVWGEGLDDVAITGTGRIFGRGLSRGTPGRRRDLLPEERTVATKPDLALPPGVMATLTGQPVGPFGYPGREVLPAGVGNKAIALKNCRNVTLRDFTLFHGGHFAILATGVDTLTIDNLKIDTNRDGIDLDACQNVRVSNCTINSPYDDALCLKSSFALGQPRWTENVTITNCLVSGYDEGTMLDGTRRRTVHHVNGAIGRIKCGTESNGGFRNIAVSNCIFDYCRGLALESVDGGAMENITVSNLTMRDITNAPIFIRLGARRRGPEGTRTGTARRIKIQDVVAHNVAAQSGILIAGLAGAAIEQVSLSNILIEYAGGHTADRGRRVVPELEAEYPEPWVFGVMPAWGLWARHVHGLKIDRVTFHCQTPDFRPAVMLDDARSTSLDRVELTRSGDAASVALRRVSDFTLTNSAGLSDVRRGDFVSHEDL